MKSLEDALKTADIHADRLQLAIEHMKSYFPISPKKLDSLSYEEITTLELYTSRFSRLQDHMGNNVFPILLASFEEPVTSMTFTDRLNKLEALGILQSAQDWREARDIRNHISHEYPDNLELMAANLNRSYEMKNILLDCLKRVHEEAAKLKNMR